MLLLSGRKAFLISLTSRTQEGVEQIERLLRNDIDAVVDNVKEIYSNSSGMLSELERDTFFYDVQQINWRQLFKDHHMRFRRKILKEKDSNLVEARQRMQRITVLYSLVKVIVYASLTTITSYALLRMTVF
jgi:hypothetical protein